MTLDRSAKEFANLVQQSQTVQSATAPSGGRAGTTISLRIDGRAVRAVCLTSITPGPVVAVLLPSGWGCLPVAATRLTSVRQVEFRQRRDTVVPAVVGQIKALLRTGEFGSYRFWVGGDRATPFGPITLPDAIIDRGTIMATGPGLDDWVACFESGDPAGADAALPVTVYFYNADGLIRSRLLPNQVSDQFINTASKGVLASHVEGTLAQWTTPDSQDSGAITVTGELAALNAFPNYILPGQIAVSSLNTFNSGFYAALSPLLDYAYLSINTTPRRQTLFSSSAVPVSITPEIPGLNLFFRATSLVDLILYSHDPDVLSPVGTNQPETLVVEVPTERWQLYPNGTWESLPTINLAYQSNAGYRRIDVSYHP